MHAEPDGGGDTAYVYFVWYCFAPVNGTVSGASYCEGNTEVTTPEPITSIEHVKALQVLLASSANSTQVALAEAVFEGAVTTVVRSFQLLRTETNGGRAS